MMKLLVHGLGAWFAVEAASGRYPRPVAVGLTMLVTRLGAPATAFAVAGYWLKRMQEAGAFKGLPGRPRAARRRTLAKVQQGSRRSARSSSAS